MFGTGWPGLGDVLISNVVKDVTILDNVTTSCPQTFRLEAAFF